MLLIHVFITNMVTTVEIITSRTTLSEDSEIRNSMLLPRMG